MIGSEESQRFAGQFEQHFMHAISEVDESIGSLLMFVSVSGVATTPKILFPSLKFCTHHCNLARNAARESDGCGGNVRMVLIMAVLYR